MGVVWVGVALTSTRTRVRVHEIERSSLGTLATHAGQDPDQWRSKAVVSPISVSTTFTGRTRQTGERIFAY